MLSELENRLREIFRCNDRQSHDFLTDIWRACDRQAIGETEIRKASRGFDLCRQLGAKNDEELWEWFSRERIPGLGKTLLQASLDDGPDSVRAYLDHLQNGGYA